MYNIHNYLLEKKRIVFMTLERVLTDIKGDSPVKLLDSAHKSVKQINEAPFYIGTNFKQIDIKLNPKFVIVSAPGATGKSAFGKYLAYIKKALYWNLADLHIGDGTFQGTLYKALGASKISEYAQKLKLGKSTLIIDAFDEAEIISGRKNIETFLYEANEFLEDSICCSIVLLSRTETAQNIATFFTANEIPFKHLEIDYFPETNARDFVLRTAEKRKELTKAIVDCVDGYFMQVKALISDKETLNKFLGYAPVLEAIATHITEISNTARLISNLQEKSDEISLIKTIMENLLEREQNKFVSAFKERINSDKNKINKWSEIYSAKEQLVRIINYIILGEISYKDYQLASLPDYLVDDYEETIALFIPQHPFVQMFCTNETETNIDFAGPAFRDYCLARIILDDEYEDSAELYYQSESSTSHFPSQLFWNHYIDLNNKTIKSKHFSYLLEAYKSKISSGHQIYIDISQDSNETVATFRMFKGKDLIDTVCMNVSVIDNMFIFDSINNMSINIDNDIKIGGKGNTQITDSSIACNNLLINSKNLLINAFSPSITTIQCSSSIKALKSPPLNISFNNSGEIKIDVPNIYEFPKFNRFKYNSNDTSKIDIYIFIHSLRKIMSSFRTHGKDMPARDAEKIDFVVVGDDYLKNNIFEFLKENEVVFREAHLYKVNIDKMSALGISWGGLITSNILQLDKIYKLFSEWLSKKNNV